MSRKSVPYFDVKKEKKYQDFYKIIWLVEIICEKKIKFIEYPWDYFNDCHHEKERLKNVVD